jgi:hypothetical protein
MFCPQCRSEYRAGFTHCTACDADLVSQLPARGVEETHEDDAPTIVFTTGDAMEAALIRSVLEGSGITVWVFDENLSRIDSPLSILIGGMKIAVAHSQEDLALEVLKEYRGKAGQDPTHGHVSPFPSIQSFEEPDVRDSTDSEEYRCSHCRARLEAETTVCPKCGQEPW